ncbi:xylulokinase [Dellaglioa algida]|uniref:xylulokinase n=1 Tax=Dellaglioa algida TaxID=105612 RepID=UPI000BCE9C55|nr:FGGY-family carbohydrate kinase [Dellaglioa algida]MDK1717781.1 FGGY-family carbohydrate kinase [Dellaglioa algida]MDK1729315.1 FGGY-family carbohydrate kinase [Dellaglioa algida]MDK1741810.1 FGGY-family carbohydrate kinase [Dellaglioa algida]SOB50897.1 Ribulokinase [Dellaglioa algida]
MDLVKTSQAVKNGQVSLGIELGSTRIKAVLVTDDFKTIATGSFNWENQLEDGLWTYSLEQVWLGIQTSYRQMAANVQSKYHEPLTKIDSIGVSAMMHGYLVFSEKDDLLVPFRTWRNNNTEQSADELTELLNFNIPQRWSIAHLYQAVLNDETHVNDIAHLETLASYVHYKLSGKKVIGIGDASGIFPIDEKTGTYSADLLDKFSDIKKVAEYDWNVKDILPTVLRAGENAGSLTDEGAKLLDASGKLEGGSLMAPPEGDAGTGMVGTNSVRKRTGNISVGTSAFSMTVLDAPMKKVYKDIDIVTTPSGAPVAMVHVNNSSSDINAWVSIFGEFAAKLGVQLTPDQLYERLFLESTHADADAGGLINYSYLSGENITHMSEGRPLFVRTSNSNFTLPNFIQTQLYAAFAPLKIGMDILSQEEHIQTNVMIAQGGILKTAVVGQQVLANTLNIPITVMSTAGEGGPWGMAVLAIFAKRNNNGQSLEDFLDHEVFVDPESMTLSPEPEGVEGYNKFISRYEAGLPVESEAIKTIKEEKRNE